MKPEAENKPGSSVSTLLTLARQRLSHLEGSRLDTEYLLAHATGKTRAWIHTWPEETVDAENVQAFVELVQNRAIGMPLAYLTGQREFWSLPLRVTADTLIPRPETERLVELCLLHAAEASVIVELGTGCGAIALALQTELPDKTVIATDLSANALAVAKDNALKLECRLQFIQCDWMSAFSHRCADLIVSNPPYIVSCDPHLSGDGVLFEPAAALLGGADGLDAYRKIVPQAARCLRPAGMLLVEHGHDQAAPIRELMSDAGFLDITTHDDNAGLNRVSAAKLPAA